MLLFIRCGGQAEGDALLGQGETLHDPQGQGGFCCRQGLVQGGLTLGEGLAFANHGGNVPGVAQGEAMIGQSFGNGEKCGLTFIRQPAGTVPVRTEATEIGAGDFVSMYGDGLVREGCAHGFVVLLHVRDPSCPCPTQGLSPLPWRSQSIMSVLSFLPEGSVHACCVAWNGDGVLISGPPGSGKSELALRLMDVGFDLVADDRVLLDGAVASAPERLAGLIEVRGVGILKTSFVTNATVRLRVCLGEGQPRLPEPCRDPWTGAVMLRLEPGFPGTVARIRAALKACCGTYEWVAGAGENVAET